MIPSVDSLRRAGEILREIERLQTELTEMFNGTPAVAPQKRRGRPPGSGKRHKMSEEGRARIAAAAKARWARFHAAKK